MAQKLKVGDRVKVLAGRDKGRIGAILRKVGDEHAIVEGVNIVKKHERANPNAGKQGGIIEREAKIHLSNLSHINPVTEKSDRVGFRTLDDGRKVRYFKSNGEVLDV
ncbi:MAG: 50S ribosomal protein L24 [Pseudomonadota bacterium]|nr:50S ribosomal protein L24 [Pseudomonadota bacterium]